MISEILVAVDDSPGGLAAADLAIQLAAATKSPLHALAVTADGLIAEYLSATGAMRPSSADAVLRHVSELAQRAKVQLETSHAEGEVAPAVLAQATKCAAGLIVMGRTRDPHDGQGVIGSQTSQVLEFSTVPVVVVPPR